jgi:hypothetical protein
MAKRTKKGNVTAETREKSGMKGKNKGKFPVFDEKSARSALKLRNNGKGVSPSAVVGKVSRWAKKTGNKKVQKAVQRAMRSGN